jgi:hypothetical protein
MKIASVIVVLAPLLASCASSGLYNMSDEWCSAHMNASEARCPKDLKRVAHNDVAPNDNQRVASNHERRSD